MTQDRAEKRKGLRKKESRREKKMMQLNHMVEDIRMNTIPYTICKS